MVFFVTGAILSTVAANILRNVAKKLGDKIAKNVSEKMYTKLFGKKEKVEDLTVEELKQVFKEILVESNVGSEKKVTEIVEESLNQLAKNFQEVRNDINELRFFIDNSLDELMRYSSEAFANNIVDLKSELTKEFIRMSKKQLNQLVGQFETLLAPYVAKITSHVTEEHEETRSIIQDETAELKRTLDLILVKLDISPESIEKGRTPIINDTHAKEATILAERIIKKDLSILSNNDLVKLGYIEYIRYNFDKAIYYLQKAIDSDPSNVYPYIYMVYAFLRKNDIKSAKKIAEQAYKVNPEDVTILNLLAKIKWEENNKTEAQKLLEKALSKKKLMEVTYTYFAEFYLYYEDFSNAILMLDKATSLNKNYFPAYYLLGQYYLKLNEYEKAVNSFKKALSLSHEDVFVLYYLGYTYLKMKEYEKAKEYYQKALELSPKNGDILENLGYTYREMGDYKKAAEFYSKALELDPSNSRILENLGFIYRQLGEFKKSEKFYKKAKNYK